jgi:hypothetical protein
MIFSQLSLAQSSTDGLIASMPSVTMNSVNSISILTLTANPSGGSIPYKYQYYYSSPSSCSGTSVSSGNLITYSTSLTTPSTSWCYSVTDANGDVAYSPVITDNQISNGQYIIFGTGYSLVNSTGSYICQDTSTSSIPSCSIQLISSTGSFLTTTANTVGAVNLFNTTLDPLSSWIWLICVFIWFAVLLYGAYNLLSEDAERTRTGKDPVDLGDFLKYVIVTAMILVIPVMFTIYITIFPVILSLLTISSVTNISVVIVELLILITVVFSIAGFFLTIKEILAYVTEYVNPKEKKEIDNDRIRKILYLSFFTYLSPYVLTLFFIIISMLMFSITGSIFNSISTTTFNTQSFTPIQLYQSNLNGCTTSPAPWDVSGIIICGGESFLYYTLSFIYPWGFGASILNFIISMIANPFGSLWIYDLLYGIVIMFIMIYAFIKIDQYSLEYIVNLDTKKEAESEYKLRQQYFQYLIFIFSPVLFAIFVIVITAILSIISQTLLMGSISPIPTIFTVTGTPTVLNFLGDLAGFAVLIPDILLLIFMVLLELLRVLSPIVFMLGIWLYMSSDIRNKMTGQRIIEAVAFIFFLPIIILFIYSIFFGVLPSVLAGALVGSTQYTVAGYSFTCASGTSLQNAIIGNAGSSGNLGQILTDCSSGLISPINIEALSVGLFALIFLLIIYFSAGIGSLLGIGGGSLATMVGDIGISNTIKKVGSNLADPEKLAGMVQKVGNVISVPTNVATNWALQPVEGTTTGAVLKGVANIATTTFTQAIPDALQGANTAYGNAKQRKIFKEWDNNTKESVDKINSNKTLTDKQKKDRIKDIESKNDIRKESYKNTSDKNIKKLLEDDDKSKKMIDKMQEAKDLNARLTNSQHLASADTRELDKERKKYNKIMGNLDEKYGKDMNIKNVVNNNKDINDTAKKIEKDQKALDLIDGRLNAKGTSKSDRDSLIALRGDIEKEMNDTIYSRFGFNNYKEFSDNKENISSLKISEVLDNIKTDPSEKNLKKAKDLFEKEGLDMRLIDKLDSKSDEIRGHIIDGLQTELNNKDYNTDKEKLKSMVKNTMDNMFEISVPFGLAIPAGIISGTAKTLNTYVANPIYDEMKGYREVMGRALDEKYSETMKTGETLEARLGKENSELNGSIESDLKKYKALENSLSSGELNNVQKSEAISNMNLIKNQIKNNSDRIQENNKVMIFANKLPELKSLIDSGKMYNAYANNDVIKKYQFDKALVDNQTKTYASQVVQFQKRESELNTKLGDKNLSAEEEISFRQELSNVQEKLAKSQLAEQYLSAQSATLNNIITSLDKTIPYDDIKNIKTGLASREHTGEIINAIATGDDKIIDMQKKYSLILNQQEKIDMIKSSLQNNISDLINVEKDMNGNVSMNFSPVFDDEIGKRTKINEISKGIESLAKDKEYLSKQDLTKGYIKYKNTLYRDSQYQDLVKGIEKQIQEMTKEIDNIKNINTYEQTMEMLKGRENKQSELIVKLQQDYKNEQDPLRSKELQILIKAKQDEYDSIQKSIKNIKDIKNEFDSLPIEMRSSIASSLGDLSLNIKHEYESKNKLLSSLGLDIDSYTQRITGIDIEKFYNNHLSEISNLNDEISNNEIKLKKTTDTQERIAINADIERIRKNIAENNDKFRNVYSEKIDNLFQIFDMIGLKDIYQEKERLVKQMMSKNESDVNDAFMQIKLRISQYTKGQVQSFSNSVNRETGNILDTNNEKLDSKSKEISDHIYDELIPQFMYNAVSNINSIQDDELKESARELQNHMKSLKITTDKYLDEIEKMASSNKYANSLLEIKKRLLDYKTKGDYNIDEITSLYGKENEEALKAIITMMDMNPELTKAYLEKKESEKQLGDDKKKSDEDK